MKIIRHAHETPAAAKGAVTAVGNFDGLHLGHQSVIAETRRLAAQTGAPAAVMTFEPHPRALFAPAAPPFRLTPFRAKARLIEASGVDALFALPFTRALAAFSPDEFIEQVLAAGAGCAHIVAGGNFRFGKDRAGGIETLARAGARLGFGVTAAERAETPGGEAYSSTAVRARLAAGDAAGAADLLGRAHEIHGRARNAGAGRGADAAGGMGAGALLLRAHEISLPAEGVYTARIRAEGRSPAWTDARAELRHTPGPNGRPAAEFIIRPETPLHCADPAGRAIRLALTGRA